MSLKDKLFWCVLLLLGLLVAVGMLTGCSGRLETGGYRLEALTAPGRQVELTWEYDEGTEYHWRSNMVFYVYRREAATGPWECVAATDGDRYTEAWGPARTVWFAVVASNTVTEQVSGKLTTDEHR